MLGDDLTIPAHQATADLWQQAGLPSQALAHLDLPGTAPILPSSFAVATAAQASMGAAALAAAEIRHLRLGHKGRQPICVPREHAVLESLGYFTLDGKAPLIWDKLSGLYPCGARRGEPGWVRIHANFAHHRDGALKLLGCIPGAQTERSSVIEALRDWTAIEFETAAAQAGLVVAATRSFEDWDQHPQAQGLRALPTVSIERIDDAPVPALPWPDLAAQDRPLKGLRVLDLTRILAGPVAGRTLAAYGAEVMLVNSPTLPNIDAIADTSRGKLSTHIDLRTPGGQDALKALLSQAHVFMQAYRPGGMADLGWGPQALAAMRPGIVLTSLSAYGQVGPWSTRRGFDSLVQTATGFNHAEALAANAPEPKALPLQILDYAAGYLLAFGTQAALYRQAHEGGSWHVQVSLAGVGHWLRKLGRVPEGLATKRPSLSAYLTHEASGFGKLLAFNHAAHFSDTPARWLRPSMPPGSHPAAWP
jgi:hypothetical protein